MELDEETLTLWYATVLIAPDRGATATKLILVRSQGATCAVAIPIVALFRLYYPSPPLTRIIFTVSQALVVG